MEHVWRHKVGHSGHFSLFRQGPFQRTLKRPKVTGTRGSWDLAVSLKMISKTRRLMPFAFYKVKMSVLERLLSGQKALPRLMTPIWGLGPTWERKPTPACYSVTSTHAHTTQDQCCSARISILLCLWSTHPCPPSPNLLSHRAQDKCSYEVAGSCWSSARACPTAVLKQRLTFPSDSAVTSSTWAVSANTG